MSVGNKIKSSLSWAGSCYGVDLRPESCAVVRAERVRGQLVYHKVGVDDPRYRQAVQNGAACVGCLSARESITRWIESPFGSKKKAVKVLSTLLDIELPFALEECICEFQEIHKTQAGSIRALAIAARRTDIEKRQATFRAADLDPIGLDQEGLALWTQSLREKPAGSESADALRLIVHLNVDAATIVVGKGKRYLNAHNVRMNDLNQIEGLVRSYLESENPEQQTGGTTWIWSGAASTGSELLNELKQRLLAIWKGSSISVDEPECFLARALATRALLDGPLRVNLLSGELAHPAALQRGRQRVTKAAVLLFLAGLIICAASVAALWMSAQRHRSIKMEIATFAGRLTGQELTTADENTLIMALDAGSKRVVDLKPFINAFQPSLLNTLTEIVSMGAAGGLQFESFQLESENIQLAGTAKTWTACDDLMKYLDQQGYNPVLERKDALDDRRIPFRIMTGGRDDQ